MFTRKNYVEFVKGTNILTRKCPHLRYVLNLEMDCCSQCDWELTLELWDNGDITVGLDCFNRTVILVQYGRILIVDSRIYS